MKKIYILSLLASLLTFTACSSTSSVATEEKVRFNSMLDGAQVYVDGAFVGETPCDAVLCVNSSHEVKFVKEGFKPEIYTLSPTLADANLGSLVDANTPKTLSPNAINAEMKPELLPTVPGKTAFETYTENYIKVDALRKFGAISDEEYEYIVKYMQEFYGQED